MATAVITGGSSGIGLEFARALAAKNYDLILIARGEENLQRATIELSKFAVQVKTMNLDLSDPEQISLAAKKVRAAKNLEILVNAAGFALHEKLLDSDQKSLAKQRAAFLVMAETPLILSAAAAENMRKNLDKKSVQENSVGEIAARNSKNSAANSSENSAPNPTISRDFHGKIINVASTSAWTFQGNYSALKRWLVTFTESLNLELKQFSHENVRISATAVCPAWMHTNFHAAANLGEPSVPNFLYQDPRKVAKKTLRAAEKGKIIFVYGALWKTIIFFLSHAPKFVTRKISQKYLASKNYQK